MHTELNQTVNTNNKEHNTVCQQQSPTTTCKFIQEHFQTPSRDPSLNFGISRYFFFLFSSSFFRRIESGILETLTHNVAFEFEVNMGRW